MSVVVINRLRFSVPVDEVASRVAAAFPPAFDGLDGFERFELVKVADDRAVVLIHWRDLAAAQAGAAAIGPTVFHEVVMPFLASEQDRVAGPVVVAHPAP
jgi:heme-degrading monooxygenase HmoA